MAPSRAVVDLSAYAHNLRIVRGLIPAGCRIAAVVKADAYGHGAIPVGRRALECGAEMLAVACIDEAVQLRQAGIEAPILTMVQPTRDALPVAVEHDLDVMISDLAAVHTLSELARRRGTPVRIHGKVDTGMGRQGFWFETAAEDLARAAAFPHIVLAGVATHFPVADTPDDPFTREQIARFDALLDRLRAKGIAYGVAHAANSAGIIHFPESAFDMVRPGLMTYGVEPTDSAPPELRLKPVLRWETSITLIRDMPAGATIGYGRTCTAHIPMRVALLPVGYADGFRWVLANRGEALIHGCRCPVRGRVSMDQIVVDVSGVPDAAPGDTAVLLGEADAQTIGVGDMARAAGTIPYDIFTGLGRRVERRYVG